MATQNPRQTGTGSQAPQEQQQARMGTQGQQGGGNGHQQTIESGQERQASRGQDVQVGQGGQSSGGALQRRPASTMARYARDPFMMMQQFSEEMDNLFDSFLSSLSPSRRTRPSSQMPDLWMPDVEVRELGNQLRINVDVPGVQKENLRLDIQEGMLTIEGERNEERSEGGEDQGYRRTERRYGKFYRTLPLPEGVDTENAQATMKDGVLDITLPLAPNKQKRRLQING